MTKNDLWKWLLGLGGVVLALIVINASPNLQKLVTIAQNKSPI